MDTKTICPKCAKEIPLGDVNVATDVALCRRCGQAWSFADLLADARLIPTEHLSPPRGAWLREPGPGEFEVGVSTRSPIAFFLVPFMCVWSGGSLGGIYGTQIAKGHFELAPSLFGIPFFIGTLFLGSLTLMSVFGKVVVKVRGDEGVVFIGVGPVGWSRRFNWRRVSGIRLTEKWGNRGTTSQQITLEGEKRIDFGTGLSNERIDFLFGTLRRKWRESGYSR